MDFHSSKPVVAIVGGFQIGKSTLVNCLLDDRYAPTGNGLRTTAATTLFQYGEAEEAWLFHGNDAQGERLARRQDVFNPSWEIGPDDWFRISAWKPILQNIDIVDTPGYNALDTDDKSASAAIAASSIVIIVQAGKTMDELCRSIVRESCKLGKRCIFLLNCTNTECWAPDDPQNEAICKTIEAELISMGMAQAFIPIKNRLVVPINAFWAWHATGQASRAMDSTDEKTRTHAEHAVRKILNYVRDELGITDPSPSDLMTICGLSDVRQLLMDLGHAFAPPPNMPEEFCDAYRTPSADVALLGKPTGEPCEYVGIGEIGSALPMENGLLIHHKLLESFSVLPWKKDGEQTINILSPIPKTVNWSDETDQEDLAISSDGEKMMGNPLLSTELECFKQFAEASRAAAPLVKEMEWYRMNSAAGYQKKNDEIVARILELDKAIAECRRELSGARQTQKTAGLLSSFSLGIKSSWLESKIHGLEMELGVLTTSRQELDEDSARHEAWPIGEKTEELSRMEIQCHDRYLSYCLARHFRIRIDEEVQSERNEVSDLTDDVEGLRGTAANYAKKIKQLESLQSTLKQQLVDIEAEISNKSAECAVRSERIANLEQQIVSDYRSATGSDA